LTKRAGGLASPEMVEKHILTNSIMVDEPMHRQAVPLISISAPQIDVSKKRGEDSSDYQATNIYNSNNSIDPNSASRTDTHQDQLLSHKTNKFEDKVLSSYLPEYQPPKKISFQNITNITESIVEGSSRHSSPQKR
jgi:hypothetical protein